MKKRNGATKPLKKYQRRRVVWVNEEDKKMGEGDLLKAHREPGKRHRAFSLLLYRRRRGKIEVLLQKRAREKPVFAGYWANTCCGNMAPGEEYLTRAVTRVREEMGITVERAALTKLYKFTYYAADKDGWCERELDQVIVGEWEGEVRPNPEEVADYQWLEWGEMKRRMKKNPEDYAPWWRMIVKDGRMERRTKNE